MKNKLTGDLVAEDGRTYEYTEITGSLAIGKNTTAEFPRLESVGGGVYAHHGSKLSLPVCTSVGGDVTAYSGSKLTLPVCTSVGGYVTAHSGSTLTLPVDCKKVDSTAPARCRAMLLSAFAASGYSFADGILARIVSQRGQVQRVIICGKTDISYVVSDDEGNSAHGDTLDEARADLMVKRTSRDLTPFKSWTLDKVVSKSDAIWAYRSITGACAKGVRMWLEQRKTPETIAVKDIVALTAGAYGSEKFAGFFVGGK